MDLIYFHIRPFGMTLFTSQPFNFAEALKNQWSSPLSSNSHDIRKGLGMCVSGLWSTPFMLTYQEVRLDAVKQNVKQVKEIAELTKVA